MADTPDDTDPIPYARRVPPMAKPLPVARRVGPPPPPAEPQVPVMPRRVISNSMMLGLAATVGMLIGLIGGMLAGNTGMGLAIGLIIGVICSLGCYETSASTQSAVVSTPTSQPESDPPPISQRDVENAVGWIAFKVCAAVVLVGIGMSALPPHYSPTARLAIACFGGWVVGLVLEAIRGK